MSCCFKGFILNNCPRHSKQKSHLIPYYSVDLVIKQRNFWSHSKIYEQNINTELP